MEFNISVLLSFCILIPALIGLIRFSKIDPMYRPFIYCIWIGLFNELLSFALVKSGHSNAVNGNIYILVESLFFTWQFKNWEIFRKSRSSFLFVIVALGISWIVETTIISSITEFSSYFLITYSFILAIMSITLVSRLLLIERKTLLKNPAFIICIAFIIYYTFSVIAEAFWIYGVNESKSFIMNVTNISILTNLIANILYSLAIIWMPTKQRFTLPSL